MTVVSCSTCFSHSSSTSGSLSLSDSFSASLSVAPDISNDVELLSAGIVRELETELSNSSNSELLPDLAAITGS